MHARGLAVIKHILGRIEIAASAVIREWDEGNNYLGHIRVGYPFSNAAEHLFRVLPLRSGPADPWFWTPMQAGGNVSGEDQ